MSRQLTRRGLLRWSALAAGATLLPLRAGPAAATADPDPYDLAFAAAVAADPAVRAHSEPGNEFLYRPGQLLTARRDAGRVARWLTAAGIGFDRDAGFGTVARFRLAADTDIPALVTRLREPGQWRGRPPAVQPHHVLLGYDNIMGNPGTGPVAVGAPAPAPARPGTAGRGVLVGICDTGIWHDAAQFHAARLGGAYQQEPDDEDKLYAYDDVLALQGGHGTFVAGVLRETAPGVRFDPEVALSGTGIGDEEMLVAAIDRLDRRVRVLNLSLGCRTQDDIAPLAVADRIAALTRTVAVVAAAGNAGGDRPAWPAALPGVIAVAAAENEGIAITPAAYSNFGPWVDATAPGTRTSTYVTGVLEVKDALPQHFEGFARWSGTSFAAPHVAGRIAELMSAKGLPAPAAAAYLLNQPSWKEGYGVLVP